MSRVDHILRLLGADEAKGRTPCLIPIPAKQKGPVFPDWNKVDWERMQDEDYRAQLEASPNLGVILGKQSGPLATVDIDVEEYVGPFLEANPRLRQCLRTRGAKGCQIWAWLKPDPKLVGLGLRRAGDLRFPVFLASRAESRGLAKGLTRGQALRRHALRPALGGLLAALVPECGWAVGGTAVAEVVFAVPGISAYLVESVAARDYFALQAYVVAVAAWMTAVHLAATVLRRAIDPRTVR